MKKRVVYVLSNLNKALAFEWIAEELDRHRFNLSFILLNPGGSELERFLVSRNVPCYRIPYRGKQDLPNAIYQLVRLLRRERADVVHCHLFDACIAGLTAARLAGVRKRIYTRHHSTLHHVYFPRAVWYDRYVNAMATDIVAISRTVQDVLLEKENVSPRKIHLVHHGFRLADFERVAADRIDQLKTKYNLAGKEPVVGVISRYVDWKGIQYVIPAFGQLLNHYPNARLVLANAAGNFGGTISKLLRALPPDSYTEISFETDIHALYHTFDIFVHVPVDPHSEAFGQTYVEALAAGVPSVFTVSGIAGEFVVHRENALVVPFQNPKAICAAMRELLTDKMLTRKLVERGKTDVCTRFELPCMITALEALYEQR